MRPARTLEDLEPVAHVGSSAWRSLSSSAPFEHTLYSYDYPYDLEAL